MLGTINKDNKNNQLFAWPRLYAVKNIVWSIKMQDKVNNLHI